MYDGNQDHCKVLSKAGSSGSVHKMRIADNDQDNTWYAYYNSAEAAHFHSNAGTGLLYVNGERHNSSDTAYAEFLGLDEAFSNWSKFDNLRSQASSDNQFHFVRIATDHGQVVHN